VSPFTLFCCDVTPKSASSETPAWLPYAECHSQAPVYNEDRGEQAGFSQEQPIIGLFSHMTTGLSLVVIYLAALALVALLRMGCSQQMISWTSSQPHSSTTTDSPHTSQM
jgi:hypothetical protein